MYLAFLFFFHKSISSYIFSHPLLVLGPSFTNTSECTLTSILMFFPVDYIAQYLCNFKFCVYNLVWVESTMCMYGIPLKW
uniref:Uncharacterized protein n=1 Tax=Arundo donax TaxID=35708 RepID=A0A0A9CBG5_ARUDO